MLLHYTGMMPPAFDILETFSGFFQEDSITVQSEIQKFRVEHIHILTEE